MEQMLLQHTMVVVAWNFLPQFLELCLQPPSKLSDLLVLVLCNLVEILLESINGALFPKPIFYFVQQGFHALLKPHSCCELPHFTPYGLNDCESDNSHGTALQSLLHLPDPLLTGGFIFGTGSTPENGGRIGGFKLLGSSNPPTTPCNVAVSPWALCCCRLSILRTSS